MFANVQGCCLVLSWAAKKKCCMTGVSPPEGGSCVDYSCCQGQRQTFGAPLGGKVEWQGSPLLSMKWEVRAALLSLLKSKPPSSCCSQMGLQKKESERNSELKWVWILLLPTKASGRQKSEYQENYNAPDPMCISALNSFELFVPVDAYFITESQKKRARTIKWPKYFTECV